MPVPRKAAHDLAAAGRARRCDCLHFGRMLKVAVHHDFIQPAFEKAVRRGATRHQQIHTVQCRIGLDALVIDRVLQGIGSCGTLRMLHHLDVKIVPGGSFLEGLVLHAADDDFRTLVIVLVDQTLNPLDFRLDGGHLCLTALRLIKGVLITLQYANKAREGEWDKRP